MLQSVHEHMTIMSEEYRSVEKLSVLRAFKICALPENLYVHSGSSRIFGSTEKSQLLTSAYENQSINLFFKSLSGEKECLIISTKVCEFVRKVSLTFGV